MRVNAGINSRAIDGFQMLIIPTFISCRRSGAADQTLSKGKAVSSRSAASNFYVIVDDPPSECSEQAFVPSLARAIRGLSRPEFSGGQGGRRKLQEPNLLPYRTYAQQPSF